MSDWADYVAATTRLAVVRRSVGGGTGMTGELAELSDTLIEQQNDLTSLAKTLRLPAPSFPPAGRGEVADLAEPLSAADRLARARRRLHDANVAADSAEDLGGKAPLLPTWRPLPRTALVYAGCSVAGLLAQIILMSLYSKRVVTDQISMYAWTCCGFPAIAFIVGYLLVGLASRPRRSTGPVNRSARLGAAICAASLPVYALVLGAVNHVL